MMTSKPALVRAIGRWSLVALTVNSMIGSGVFGLPGTVAALLGKQSVLAVLIAGGAIGVIMMCFAEVASQYSEAGGPYLYARSVFGRLVGLLVGWTFYLAQSAAPAANANLFVIYLAEFWPGAKAFRLVILSILIGLLAVINILGVRQGTRVSNLFTVAKLLPLLMVVLVGAAVTIFHPAPMPAEISIAGGTWMRAMVLLVFAFGGFETALVPLGEARDPRRDVGFALLVSLVACIAIYALVQWVVVGVLGSGAATDRPLAEVARLTMGNRGAALVSIGALVSVYGYLGAKLLSMPRTTFALAEGGDLPGPFAWVSRRFHTPWLSILMYAVTVWGLALAGNFAWNVTLSAIARLFYYAVVCAALIVMRRRNRGAAKFHLPGGPLWAVLGVTLCLAMVSQVDLSQSRILVVTVGAAFLNWVWVKWRARPAA
jgi:APA family basic amino acid/polyamine antiporter